MRMGFIFQEITNKTKQQQKLSRRGKTRQRQGLGRAGQDRTREGQGRTGQGRAGHDKTMQEQEQETFDDELAQDCKHKEIIKGSNEESNEVGQINQ